MVNTFRWVRLCPAIIKHLLYGMEKMHCHRAAAERAIEGRPGLLSAAQALTVTQAGGWWASGLHTALARRLRRREEKKKTPTRPGNETRVRKYVVVWPNLGPEASAELQKKNKSPKVSSEAVQQLPNAAEKAGAQPGRKETPSLLQLKIYSHICMHRANVTHVPAHRSAQFTLQPLSRFNES